MSAIVRVRDNKGVVHDIPAIVGPKGDTGATGPQGKPGSDASVTADNIQAALGYTPVKDVQVAGSSVLDGGVANVPMASETKAGVIKAPFADRSFGILLNKDHRPYVVAASEEDITARQTVYRPLVPARMDYAMKAAMCDGKGAAWTEAEQKAARWRMGVDKEYELIEKIVIQEPVSVISRDVSLEDLYVEIVTPDTAEATSNVQYGAISIDDEPHIISLGVVVKPGQTRYAKIIAEKKHGRYSILSYRASTATDSLTTYFEHNSTGVIGQKITKIRLYNTLLIAGTEISIYGVRA